MNNNTYIKSHPFNLHDINIVYFTFEKSDYRDYQVNSSMDSHPFIFK
jgi:hypothetical protein